MSVFLLFFLFVVFMIWLFDYCGGLISLAVGFVVFFWLCLIDLLHCLVLFCGCAYCLLVLLIWIIVLLDKLTFVSINCAWDLILWIVFDFDDCFGVWLMVLRWCLVGFVFLHFDTALFCTFDAVCCGLWFSI